MRKVIFSLNNWTDSEPGYFHCWAGTMQDAYALIEDTTTGTMHRMNDNQFRFVQPPETKMNKNEGMELVNVLVEVVKKLDAIACKIEGA